ncbi:HdeA/HdeB family chaperone [Desulfosediminicola ganghwensis]|uniref:HdeA/HdeB family chaperone n=1 Tax=Desulfosediminicola ganghwensis TaxID=2569540 RepID=UPI00142F02B9|nr:HdeA/HdeB family chaperone [Desulfosediminicola ganghwensis]
MIFKKILMLMVASLVLAGTAAYADDEETVILDLETLTCKELMAGDDTERAAGFGLYQGILAGEKGQLKLDVDKAYQLTEDVKDYCLSNATSTVLDAFRKADQ